MPTYRVYYAERVPGVGDSSDPFNAIPTHRAARATEYVQETEWEEEFEAKNEAAALEVFFRDHVRDRSQVMWVDEDGQRRPIEGVGDYDPDKTYIWVENEKLMEYQGIDEATPGMVTCPLCDGQGEVDDETADEFLAAYGAEGGDPT